MKTLVLGVGNLLMGDEGVGIHVVRHLQERARELELAPDVDLVDGGTGGFHLLEYFESYPRLILVDAALDGGTPGAVRMLRPRYSSDYPPNLSAHDIGLKDLIDSAALMGLEPAVVLFTITVAPAGVVMGTDLTDSTRAAVVPTAERIAGYLREHPDSP